MANKLYEETHIQAIADAIREKNGTDTKYDVSEMATAVNEIGSGESDAVSWDVITSNNTRSHYGNGFRYWNSAYIRPPYKIIPTSRGGSLYMFAYNTNLLKVEKEYFDLSQITNPSQTNGSFGNQCVFSGCSNLVEIEDIGMTAAMYDSTFSGCLKLEKIAIIRTQEDTIFYIPFNNCTSLKELTIEGVIGTNFPIGNSSLLSATSLKSIIMHLKNYSGTDKEYNYTLTIKTAPLTALESSGFTEDDIAWLTENGMTYTEDLTWEEVIDNLKWNLVKYS